MNEVRAGKIPKGTALIIENLDRLSRQGIDKTTDLLKALTQAGIDIHVIGIQRVLKAGFNNSLVDYRKIVEVQEPFGQRQRPEDPGRCGARDFQVVGLGAWESCHLSSTEEMNLSRSLVVQVLSHRPVLGEFKMVSSGEVVPGYFPQT